jgi:FixJ family two-component response regulator
MYGRKRRGSVQHVQNLGRSGASVRVPVPDLRPVVSPASAPPRPSCSQPDGSAAHRYRARRHKLTPEQEGTIRTLAATKSLRSLAADFGVSHETVRAVLRQGGRG